MYVVGRKSNRECGPPFDVVQLLAAWLSVYLELGEVAPASASAPGLGMKLTIQATALPQPLPILLRPDGEEQSPCPNTPIMVAPPAYPRDEKLCMHA